MLEKLSIISYLCLSMTITLILMVSGTIDHVAPLNGLCIFYFVLLKHLPVNNFFTRNKTFLNKQTERKPVIIIIFILYSATSSKV